MDKIVKVGSEVIYRGDFGYGFPTKAKVEEIEEVTPGYKDGNPVDEVSLEYLRNGRNYVISLDDGHWAYGEQVVDVI